MSAQTSIVLLHTSPVHPPVFDAIFRRLDPDLRISHIIDVSLLDDARSHGITEELEGRIRSHIAEARANGGRLVLCTCSTIGSCAEAAGETEGITVLRVDRPMMEAAVSRGTRITLVAALESTLRPSRELLEDVAREAGQSVTIAEVVCSGAWPLFEAGDTKGYLTEIARAIQSLTDPGDVIVLAQASMAGVVELLAEYPVPVLSSPVIGAKVAKAACQNS